MAGDGAWRLDDLLDPGARFVGMPPGFDIGGGDTAGWGRGCDGPLWSPELRAFTFSDCGHGRRLSWAPGQPVRVVAEGLGAPLGAAEDAQGRLLICDWEGRRLVRLEADGAAVVLAASYQGISLNRPDDVAVSASGDIFFTDLPAPFPPSPDVSQRGGLYRLASDSGALERLDVGVDRIGGLAFSPDGGRLYISDPDGRRILAAPALGGPAEVVATLAGDGQGAPHGLCVDALGNIYVGGPGGLWILSPEGRTLGALPLSASRVTNAVFGGAEGRTLFITTPVGAGAIEMRVAGLVRPAHGGPAPPTQPINLPQRIERKRPALDSLIAPGEQITNLYSGGFFDDLGGGEHELYARSLEGLAWNERDGCLYFSDIGNSRRMRLGPDGALSLAHRPTNHTNGVTIDPEGRIISCEHASRQLTRVEHDGSVAVLLDRANGKRLNRPNDVVVRSDGDIFFTDPWWDFGSGETSDIGHPAVHHVSADLKTVRLLISDMITPNGLCFSPDETVLYINDTRGQHIKAFDVLDDGSIDLNSARVLCELTGDRPGKPDGMKVDVDGNIYCGGAGGLWVVSPAGERLGTIVHGGLQTNNLCFGGADLRTLYFCSWIGLHSIQVLRPGATRPSSIHRGPPC